MAVIGLSIKHVKPEGTNVESYANKLSSNLNERQTCFVVHTPLQISRRFL